LALASETSKSEDVVIVHGPTDDRKGLKVLRARTSPEGEQPVMEVGEVRPLEQGKPIHGDVVRLRPRTDAPWVCDVETQASLESLGGKKTHQDDVAARQKTHTGPARVATNAYRSNWDAIWPQRRREPGPN